MEKFSGRFYVSVLIVVAIMDTASRAVNIHPMYWFGVAVHAFCLLFVIKDGVK